MTPEQMAEIKARYEKTTPGEWFDQTTDSGYLRVTTDEDAVNGICGFGDMEEVDGTDLYNADFIAQAHQDIPALLKEVQRLQILLAWQASQITNGKTARLLSVDVAELSKLLKAEIEAGKSIPYPKPLKIVE